VEGNITFTPQEWKYFLEEVKMRGIEKVNQCINNARYLAMLDRSEEQAKRGEVTKFTWKEWKEFVNNARSAVS